MELVPHIRQCRSRQNICQTISQHELGVVTYGLYACVADCADAMTDAWEDTAGYVS